MKIKPTTLFLVLAAALMGGVVIVAGNQRPPEQTESQLGQKLFAFEEKQVQSLTVKTQLRSLQFERDQSGKWQMTEPEKTVASDASIAYLLDLLAGKSDRTFTALASDRESFGFHQPLATINVVLNNQETHKLLLGGYDFNRSFIYALVDPPPALSGEIKVFLASPNFENAVNRPFEEWKQLLPSPTPTGTVSPTASPEVSPPPTATPLPSASLAPSPALSPEASPSPNASPSPTP